MNTYSYKGGMYTITKRCPKCGETKEENQFVINKSGSRIGQLRCHCKKCSNETTRKWKYKHGQKPMSQSKQCSSYLGVYITEHVLSKEFKTIIRMPYGNPDYDLICGKGYKIDCKSSCLHQGKRGVPTWKFCIKYNNKTDFFLLIGWDNREDLNPLKIWLIPSYLISSKASVTITNSPTVLKKWEEFERSINNVLTQCKIIRGEFNNGKHNDTRNTNNGKS